MERIVVIYKSKSGFSQKYAEWIAQALGCPMLENKGLTLTDLEPWDTIIYGGGLYAVGINGIELIKTNFNELKGKRLIVFATGATPPREEDLQKVWESNFSSEQRAAITRFYFRGGFDFTKLGRVNKLMISLLKVKLRGETAPSEDAVGMLAAIDEPVDFSDPALIRPLIDFVGQTS